MYNVIRRLGDSKSKVMLLVAVLFAVACGDPQERPDGYTDDTSDGATPQEMDPCASPKAGCSCSQPGEIVDCGQVTVKVDNYVTCFEGSRLCDAKGIWGDCQPDQVVAESSRQVSGLGRR